MKQLSLKQWIAIVVALLVVLWFFGSNAIMTSLFNRGEGNVVMNDMTDAQSSVQGLTSQDIVVGTGATAVAGKLVTTHYTGMFMDGRVFDTSTGRQPFSFPLGQGFVIQGWEKGIEGMKVGGKRKLIIAPELGYGFVDMKDGAGNVVIPANTTLVFEVELIDVK